MSAHNLALWVAAVAAASVILNQGLSVYRYLRFRRAVKLALSQRRGVPQHPWINKHGKLLRHVQRPVRRATGR